MRELSRPIRSFCRSVDTVRNYWSLPCGALTPDSAALLASSALRERMTELRSEFDYVIIDAPPLIHYADAIALSRVADGLILVVEAGSTRRDENERRKNDQEQTYKLANDNSWSKDWYSAGSKANSREAMAKKL